MEPTYLSTSHMSEPTVSVGGLCKSLVAETKRVRGRSSVIDLSFIDFAFIDLARGVESAGGIPVSELG